MTWYRVRMAIVRHIENARSYGEWLEWNTALDAVTEAMRTCDA